MPVLNQIFLFVLLQMGPSRKSSVTSEGGRYYWCVISNPMTHILQVQGDEPLLERAVERCQQQGLKTTVQRDYGHGAKVASVEISFPELKSDQRTALMRQLLQEIGGRVYMEWLNGEHPGS